MLLLKSISLNVILLLVVAVPSLSTAFVTPRAPKTFGRSTTTCTTTTGTCIDDENNHRMVSSSSSLNSAVILDDQDYFPKQQQRSRPARTARQQPAARVASRPVALQAPLSSIEQLEDYVKNHGTEKYTVVKFYASWCKTCAKFGLKFDKLVATHGDWVQQSSVSRDGSIRFASVEYSSNPEMFTELDVNHLPTIHIYDSNGNKVVDTTCSPSKFSEVASHITHYVDVYKNRNQQQEQQESAVVSDTRAAFVTKTALLKSAPTLAVVEDINNEEELQSHGAHKESMSTARTVLATETVPSTSSSSLLQSIIDKEVVVSALEASYRSRSFDENCSNNNFSLDQYQQQQESSTSSARRPRWWRKLPKVVSIIFKPRL